MIIGAGLLASDAPADALPVYVAILHGRGDTGETRVYERTARSLEQVGREGAGTDHRLAWTTVFSSFSFDRRMA